MISQHGNGIFVDGLPTDQFGISENFPFYHFHVGKGSPGSVTLSPRNFSQKNPGFSDNPESFRLCQSSHLQDRIVLVWMCVSWIMIKIS